MSRRKKGHPLGAFFFLLGCLTVLGGTFMLGVITGRSWDRLPFVRKATADAAGATVAAPPGAQKARGRAADKTEQAADPTPALTFYQELTAPLGAIGPPVPAKPRGEATKREEAPRREEPARREEPPKREESSRPEESLARAEPRREETGPREDPAGGRFTVQVAAYRERPPAEALRASLAAAGHDAYLVEAQAEGGVRYRVRIGSFLTRQAAQEAAAHLAREGRPAAYVTTR